MNKNTIYFPGLNGIRAFAVFLVIFQHIESFKNKAGYVGLYDNVYFRNKIENLGHHGVLIFFVLSGFLITYLLLNEKALTSTVNVKKFYIRRILRIWPLYFLILFLGFFVFPYILNPNYFVVKTHPDFVYKLMGCIFFIPNYVLIKYGSIFAIGVLWSIGNEEQFYLIWPHFLKRIHYNKLKFFLLVLLLFVVVVKVIAYYLMNHKSYYSVSSTIFYFVEYDAMIIGGLIAYIYYDNNKLIKLLFDKRIQFLALFLIVGLYFIAPSLGPITNIVYCPLYAILILNIGVGAKSIVNTNNMVLNYLGTISYGIYIYHSIFIACGLYMVNMLGLSVNSIFGNLLLYLFSYILTIMASSLSYNIVEKPILKMKGKFEIIKSGILSKS